MRRSIVGDSGSCSQGLPLTEHSERVAAARIRDRSLGSRSFLVMSPKHKSGRSNARSITDHSGDVFEVLRK